MKYIHILCLSLFIILFQPNATSQDLQENESVIVKIKVKNVLPVGWGYLNSCIVLRNISGDSRELGDTIHLGIITGSEYEFMTRDSVHFIRFINSNKQNKSGYFPAITGCVSKTNEIWYIEGAFPVKTTNSDKDVFTDHAINSDGKALFIWDMADSETFYVDGLDKWNDKYLEKKLIIHGKPKTIIDGVYSCNIITDCEIINIE